MGSYFSKNNKPTPSPSPPTPPSPSDKKDTSDSNVDASDTEIATIYCVQNGILSDDNLICPSPYTSKTTYSKNINYTGCTYSIKNPKILKYVKETPISDLYQMNYIRKVEFKVKIIFEDCGVTGPSDCTVKNKLDANVKLFNGKTIQVGTYQTLQPVGQSKGSTIVFNDISNCPVSVLNCTFDKTGTSCKTNGISNIKYEFSTLVYFRVAKLTELVDVLYDDDTSFMRISYNNNLYDTNNSLFIWIFIFLLFLVLLYKIIFSNKNGK